MGVLFMKMEAGLITLPWMEGLNGKEGVKNGDRHLKMLRMVQTWWESPKRQSVIEHI